MDSLLQAFSSLGVDVVRHDVEVICGCYSAMLPELDKGSLMVRKGMFPGATALYKEVLALLAAMGRSEHLMDLMPYIDDYLEHYDSL